MFSKTFQFNTFQIVLVYVGIITSIVLIVISQLSVKELRQNEEAFLEQITELKFRLDQTEIHNEELLRKLEAADMRITVQSIEIHQLSKTD
ncbi:MAG: hypothetical protein JXQ90_15635 [Cyclobacteriaceae bacterium]